MADHDPATCRTECRQVIIGAFARLGCEVAVMPWTPFIVPTWYADLGMSCPHGVRWHAEPTTDQIAKWADEARRG